MRMNSPQKTARVAAFVFLTIFFLGMSTELFILPGMIVPGDAAATVRNIAASEALFRLSLVSDADPPGAFDGIAADFIQNPQTG